MVQEKEGRVKGQTVCWLWIGPYVYIPHLYGRLSTMGVTACSAAIQCRDIPSKVSHRCSTNLCVNPMHLTYQRISDKEPGYSRFTGKKLKPKVTENLPLIAEVMKARKVKVEHNTRQVKRNIATIEALADKFGMSPDSIRKILLKAPLYDLLDEIKALEEAKLPVQTTPHKVEGSLNVLDQALFTRNYNLPYNKNETSKI